MTLISRPHSPCGILGLCAALACGCAFAADDKQEPIALKFTPTWLNGSDGVRAVDLNLRASRGPHYAWIGVYDDNQGVRQWRTGYEYRIEHALFRLVLSPQFASGGFAGVSFASELGPDKAFAILGWSRSNLRPSYSLFFDPGDSVTLGAGTRAIEQVDLALFQVRDDRLHTRQQVTHGVARWRLPDRQRLTVDLSHKSGLATDGEFVKGNGFSVTYDYADYFVRFARDPYVSFTPATQTRISAGARF